MKLSFAVIIALLAFASPALADDSGTARYEGAKVANFAVNSHAEDSAGFEKLSFWSGPRGRVIDYVYGSDAKTIRLRPLGRLSDGHGFAVRFPNGLVLDVVPERSALLVSGRSGSYRKRFTWHYEGPVAGRGTFCEPCVPEPLAIPFVRENFMPDQSR